MSITKRTQNVPIPMSADGFVITPNDGLDVVEDIANINHHTAVALFSGSGGDFHVLRAGGADLIYLGIPAGVWLPILVKRVFATGTTATGIIGEVGLR